jgi:hypothetical protein
LDTYLYYSELKRCLGGKANSLSVEVTLVEFDETGAPAKTPDYEFVNIPLRVWLYFESGKKVDESDQDIFRFVGNEYDSIVIKGDTRSAIIYFRLEKVCLVVKLTCFSHQLWFLYVR